MIPRAIYPAKRPPIIMLGAHRSGTSIVSRIVRELGVWTGRMTDVNNEPWLFIRTNEWMLSQAGTNWEYPAPFDRLLADERALERTDQALRQMLSSRFWSLGYRPPGDPMAAWGWKDPRNCITLPVWLRLFPDARLVLVEREGGDAAKSLVTRREDFLNAGMEDKRRYRLLGPLKPGPSYGTRMATLESAEELVAEYQQIARRNIAAAGGGDFTVRYGELVEDPGHTVAALASALGIEASAEKIAAAAALVRRK